MALCMYRGTMFYKPKTGTLNKFGGAGVGGRGG